jgi:putative transposase
MTDERMALTELLQKSGDGDFLRSVGEAVLQILMETDVEGLIGAGRQRTGDRLNYPTATATAASTPGSGR